MRISLSAFLDAAFGFHDSESGYGANYPSSRDIRAFFLGRIGMPPTSAVIRPGRKGEPEKFQDEWSGPAAQLAEDLEELAKQIRERL